MELHDFDLFKARKEQTLAQLDAHLVRVSHAARTKIYSSGDVGEDLYFIRKGVVRLSVSMDGARVRHLYSCGRGALFGEMTFLEGGVHSTDAYAVTDVELFVLSRKTFNAFAEQHKKAAANLFEGLASVVTTRVRYLTAELVALES